MDYSIVDMTLDRHGELIEFWNEMEGIYVSEDDTYENMKKYLERNPDSSFIALHENRIVGTIQSSEDGRRGYIRHMAVRKEYRNLGIAREMVNRCLDRLRRKGIRQCRLFVLDTNENAREFWDYIGFEEIDYNYRTFYIRLDI